jgi:SAM-dependent methyltransferase
MRAETVEHLRAPISGARLTLQPIEIAGDEVVCGRLVEIGTGAWYRIEEGIADLAPHGFRNIDRHDAFCRRHGFEQGPVPAGNAVPDENAAMQIKFFSEHRDAYEIEVVASPFFGVLDRVTLGRWASRAIGKDMLVAEVGCGTGRQTLPLLRSGASLVCVDLSEDMLRLARRKALAEQPAGWADFVVGTAENLPLADGRFDVAVIFGSLHHFSDPSAALRKVAGIMKAGGRFYILENHKSPARFIFDWMMRRWMLWMEEPNEAPTAAQFLDWLGAGGLEARVRYSTYLPPHLFYLVKGRAADRLLVATDALFNAVPVLRRLGGVIIAEGVKRGLGRSGEGEHARTRRAFRLCSPAPTR